MNTWGLWEMIFTQYIFNGYIFVYLSTSFFICAYKHWGLGNIWANWDELWHEHYRGLVFTQLNLNVYIFFCPVIFLFLFVHNCWVNWDEIWLDHLGRLGLLHFFTLSNFE